MYDVTEAKSPTMVFASHSLASGDCCFNFLEGFSRCGVE